MRSLMSKHAAVRAQQRGLPPMVDELLDRYGEEQYDGHGHVIKFFSKASKRNVERDWGSRPVALISPWFDAYKVCTTDGLTITIGHRHPHRRILRR